MKTVEKCEKLGLVRCEEMNALQPQGQLLFIIVNK